MYRAVFNLASRALGLNHVWHLHGRELWDEIAHRPLVAAEPTAHMKKEFQFEHIDYLDIIKPQRPIRIKKVILYLHGGGFIEPITPYHWQFIADLVRHTQLPLGVLDYPLLPHTTLDEIYARIHDAIWRLQARFPDYEVILVGDSAGAQLALGYPQLLEAIPTHRIVAISPMVDMTLSNPEIPVAAKQDAILSLEAMPEVITRLRGQHQLTEPLVSPLFGQFPTQKILLISGTADLTNPDCRIFAKQFANQVTYIEGERLPHAYPIWPLTRNYSAKQQIYQFILGA